MLHDATPISFKAFKALSLLAASHGGRGSGLLADAKCRDAGAGHVGAGYGLGWAKDGKTAVLAQWCCWNGFVGSAAGETRRRAVAIFEHQRHGSLGSSSKRHHSQH
ncbi:hypothetical protein CCHR01_00960 [Colletotrichum chrysophilum]|uniref:Uncharacterized protein n=1 Tax=Colletotrichum chrysophilum TaxID=1836956 RepID=A0AAD9B057_9PEZI|nr:hypothetical protein CCHR01_00960 [Colletotrichum chrysophilum]